MRPGWNGKQRRYALKRGANRGIGANIARCLYEARANVILRVLRNLRLVDLDTGALSNGTLSAIGSAPSRRLTQAWSRYYSLNAQFEYADGLYYRSAHNVRLCVALYERARDALVVDDVRLL